MDIREALRTLDHFDTKMDFINIAIRSQVTESSKKRLKLAKEELRQRVLESITQFIKDK